MTATLEDIVPFDNFETASRAALKFLHQHFGFKLWMMTRTEGTDWIVLQTEDNGYNVAEGTVLKWADSFCSQMVQGLGPRIAPKSDEITVYANAPIGQQVPIGAYIGVPVTRKNGTLFGTLCAIDPEPQSSSIVNDQSLIEIIARLIGTVLESDLKILEQTRKLERFRQQAMMDSLTGLLNRRGWEQAVKTEESRAKRYGNSVAVFILDLDHLKMINDSQGHSVGDALLKSTAEVLKEVTRENDIIARLGGDEFGIIAIECNQAGSQALYSTITQTLSARNIAASTGKSLRDPPQGMAKAVEMADKEMYEQKKQHHKKVI